MQSRPNKPLGADLISPGYLAFFMTSDAPIKELAALLGQDEIRPSFTSSDASGKDSEDKPPSFLSANGSVTESDHRPLPVIARRDYVSVGRIMWHPVAAWFDSWLRTVLTGCAVGSLAGLLYRIMTS